MAGVVADLLGVDVDTVSTTASFADLGLASAECVRLTAHLEDRTGTAVAPTAVFDHPSIEAIVRFVLGADANHAAATAHSGSEPW
ncbi:acyl carrier protein [Nocardia puris]|nr:acyl carrier protein [Nocardia puris]MBF6369019.1 acyl carrier protein [Nocardia puris]MBF6462833.1 acyl carrier protein [Nocardia puris]